jgi:hypothetical protein
MGKEGVGEMNENGAMLVDFCMENNLIIGGSFFLNTRKYTKSHGNLLIKRP